MHDSAFVRKVIGNSLREANRYVCGTLKKRAGLSGEGDTNTEVMGSVYPGMTWHKLRDALRAGERVWREVTKDYSFLQPETRLFRTNLPGDCGVRALSDMEPGSEVLMLPRQNNGPEPLLLVRGSATSTALCAESHVVIGMKNPEKPFFMALIAGAPVPPAQVDPRDVPPCCSLITVGAAMDLGFGYVRVAGEGAWRRMCAGLK